MSLQTCTGHTRELQSIAAPQCMSVEYPRLFYVPFCTLMCFWQTSSCIMCVDLKLFFTVSNVQYFLLFLLIQYDLSFFLHWICLENLHMRLCPPFLSASGERPAILLGKFLHVHRICFRLQLWHHLILAQSPHRDLSFADPKHLVP